MEVILVAFGVLFGCGLFLAFCELLSVPTLRVSKTTLRAINKAANNQQNMELFLYRCAYQLGRFIKLDKYKKSKLTATLKSTDIHMSPETYVASAWVKTGVVALFILPSLVIFPIVALIILFFSMAIYFKEISHADIILKQKKDEIEYELPRFASTLTQELMSSRDVLTILSNYKKYAGTSFRKELEITVADMKSGNYEGALTRFETRVCSASLSDIVRGLISVIRGDDGVTYFRMLSHDLKQLELQRLKGIAMKQPEKVRKFSFLMLVCFVGIYAVVLVIEMFNAMGGLQ